MEPNSILEITFQHVDRNELCEFQDEISKGVTTLNEICLDLYSRSLWDFAGAQFDLSSTAQHGGMEI